MNLKIMVLYTVTEATIKQFKQNLKVKLLTV